MISLFETLALDLNHRAINRLYSYRKKKMVQNTVSYQTQEIITWISMLQVTGRAEVIGFHSQVMDCGLIERIPCGNIFTAFLAIRKKISSKKAAAKFDLQCYNTYRNTFS